MELRAQSALNSRACLVSGPEIVAERFDDVIRSNTEVSRAVLDHLCDRVQHTDNGAERWIGFGEATDAVEVPKEFVGAVDEVDDHKERLATDEHRFTQINANGSIHNSSTLLSCSDPCESVFIYGSLLLRLRF